MANPAARADRGERRNLGQRTRSADRLRARIAAA